MKPNQKPLSFSIILKFYILVYLLFTGITPVFSQNLSNYIQQAQKKAFTPYIEATTSPDYNSTSLQFSYFIDPLLTISGAPQASITLEQKIPWLGKNHTFKKLNNEIENAKSLEHQMKLEKLAFKIKESYYKMYQFQKTKDVYLAWADDIRTSLKNGKVSDSLNFDESVHLLQKETQLLDLTKKLQLADGAYQNEVIAFNEYSKNETLEDPILPNLLAMPEEEPELQFPDPYESAAFLKFENAINQHYLNAKIKNPWNPAVSLGLTYISTIANNETTNSLANPNIFIPQLQLQWNLFQKRKPSFSKEDHQTQLEEKINSLGRQLQAAINQQISARIAYDTATDKLQKVNTLLEKVPLQQTNIYTNKALEIKGLKYTFEIEQIKAVTDYYISTSKMLLFL